MYFLSLKSLFWLCAKNIFYFVLFRLIMTSPTLNDEELTETTPVEEQAHAQDEEKWSIAKTSKVWDEFEEAIFDKKGMEPMHSLQEEVLKVKFRFTTQLNRHLIACQKEKSKG